LRERPRVANVLGVRVLLTAIAGLLLAAAASASPEAIVFASDRAGHAHIFLDGRKLTSGRWRDYHPMWAPGGRRILFVSDRDGDEELYLIRRDGSALQRLTQNRVADTTPAWSPDGRWIAFARGRPGARQLYVMPAAGGRARLVVRSTARGVESWSPSWSPDGKRIVFASNRDGFFNVELYVVGADGRGLRRLTERLGDDMMPDWSPDGRRIVFVSNFDRNSELYVMGVDGTNVRRLTRTPGVWEQLPRFSDDGERLLFGTSTTLYERRLDRGGRTYIGRGWDADWR
jgi:Tol biopolymer transport system component